MNTSTAKSASGTRRGVTEQAAAAAIDSGTRVPRLPTIRGRFEEIAAAAQREQLTYLGFLAELVMAECDDRDRRRAARRIHDAGFARDKPIDEFDFEANPSVSPAVIHQLATCAWVKAGHPLCLDRLQRAVLRLDQDFHRPAALRRHRRPAYLRRPDHRNRHHQLGWPTHARRAPPADDDRGAGDARLAGTVLGHAGHRPETLRRPAR
jgi:hypothetical protein